MLQAIARAALRLDNWLQERLGRPYNALLGVGLMIEIVRRIIEIADKVSSLRDVAGQILPILLASALLIHQMGAMSHRFDKRAEGKETPPAT